jgi:voltage-gated potassium channel
MVFARQAGTAIALVTLTLVLHCAGMAGLIQWARTHLPKGLQRPGRLHSTVLMVRLTSLMICLHMLEILLWTWFYRFHCFATWESAFYFSAVSYSTVGYGDVLLQQTWRLLGPIESITGVLMCGLSASFLFAIVTRLVQHDVEASHP